MDIIDNNDNNDAHMADSNNNGNNHNNNNNSNNNEEEGDGIDDGINHERLRQISNYADQNEDYASWYWNVGTYEGNVGTVTQQRPPVGWPVYRPLSNLSEVEREDIRVGETRMVSHVDPERYEGTGITLDWGEYYVAEDEMSSDDEEQSSLSLCAEAEEIDDEELDSEEEQALSLAINDTSQESFMMNYDQLDSNVDASNPTLMGMPDIILERILHYSTEMAAEVCVLELVCKRIRRLTTNEKFWTRHPIHNHYSFGPTPRKRAFICEGLRNIRYYQKGGHANAILDVLRDEGGCVADTFRTLSADILSRMNHLGPEAHFRLRGDTIGYICELLQGYMIDRLEAAIVLAVHKVLGAVEDVSKAVQRDDMALAFRKQRDIFSLPSSFSSHGLIDSLLDSSASLPSSSGINWKWPSDNCHDILPPEAGRRIIGG